MSLGCSCGASAAMRTWCCCRAATLSWVGESRAGRTDLITALRRVLDPRSTAARPNLLDVHRPLPASSDEQPLPLTEVEVTLLDLGKALEQDLDDRLEVLNPQTGLPAEEADADEAVMGAPSRSPNVAAGGSSSGTPTWSPAPSRESPSLTTSPTLPSYGYLTYQDRYPTLSQVWVRSRDNWQVAPKYSRLLMHQLVSSAAQRDVR